MKSVKLRSFKLSLAIHVAIVLLLVLTSVSLFGEHPTPKDDSKLLAPKVVAKTVAVDSAKIEQMTKQYEAIKSNQAKSLVDAKNKADKAQSDYIDIKNKFKNLEKEAEKYEKKIEALKKEEADLKKKEKTERLKAEELRKKRELEQKRIAAQKAKIEHQKLLEAQRLEELRLKSEKEKNERILAELRRAQEEERADKIAELRGEYESVIHDALFDKWITPYNRRDVVCKVRLNVSRAGTVIGHDFISKCPEDYKKTISLAISYMGVVPKVSNEVYREYEDINFVDSGYGSLKVN